MIAPLLETEFVVLLIVAIFVAIFARRTKFPYTIALMFVGLFVAFTQVDLVPISKEMIFFLFLPPLLFEGAVHIRLDDLKENVKTISLLAIIGILISVVFIGFGLSFFLHIPLLYGLLFGAIISPTDPVSVLALFKRLGVSKKLSTIVEGESLFNDGTGVVVFEIILGLIMLHHFRISESVLSFVEVVVGGLGVGAVCGIVVYYLMRSIDDHLIEVMSTIVLAYGVFILAEFLHVSGVIAVVTAGLLIGNYGKRFAMSPTTRISIIGFWELIVFLVNSIIFIMIGAVIPVGSLVTHLSFIAIAIVLVIVGRALGVYSLATLTNFMKEKTPFRWMHLINWSGLRGSIPIALVLGIQTLDIPYKEEITVMTFGVVCFSLIVQGLTTGPLIKKLKIISFDKDQNHSACILARKAAIKHALLELKRSHDEGEISEMFYTKVRKEYEKKLTLLKKDYTAHIGNKSRLKAKQEQFARRKALLAEKSAILEHMAKDLISEEDGDEIVKEIDLALDKMGS